MNRTNTLHLVPSLGARRAGDAYVLTRKFIDGVTEYVKRWPGQVVVSMQDRDGVRNLDEIEIAPNDLPCEFRRLPDDPSSMAESIGGARLVLCSLVARLTHVPALCQAMGMPYVFVAEYSFRTRRQIIDAETHSIARRLRRYWYDYRAELRFREAIREARGIQCNGTPTYESYADCNDNRLLYFDTRVRQEMLADEAALERRLNQMTSWGPLRLAFSGRLAAMKGADHLLDVAHELDRLGVDYTMSIFGDGPLKKSMVARVEEEGLGERVTMHGVIDFRTELVPLVKNEVDLFVCCHRQGDPSCTYLETMSCGTPIVGYDNEAFEGVAATSGVGWQTPMNRPRELAEKIAELDRDRQAIAAASRAALAFATEHTFERTMDRRTGHLIQCAEGGVTEGAA